MNKVQNFGGLGHDASRPSSEGKSFIPLVALFFHILNLHNPLIKQSL